MSHPSKSVDIRELLAHADWVRAVARRLVGNASVADDVVQDAWVAALRKPPRERGNLRGWLAQLVTNQARQRGRAESRRVRREEGAARPEAQTSLADVAERAALQRELVGHVLALDEPFRSVVLLRFFEDLAPPAIATRLGVPLKTVHSRLQRAFDKLRAKLDAEYGDARGWTSALVPLCASRKLDPAPAGGSVGTTAGVWLVNANAKIGIALSAAVIGGFGLWQVTFTGGAGEPELPVDAGVSAPPSAVAPLPHEPARAEAFVGAGDALAVVEDAAAEAAPTAGADGVRIRGRAVDMRGTALEGVAIAVRDEGAEALAVTGAGGEFEVTLAGLAGRVWNSDIGRPCLRVLDEGWITLRQSCVKETNRGREHVVVAAPVSRLEGWVEDAAGAPIEAARVSLSPMGEAFFGFPYALDLTSFVPVRCATDATGRFGFERFPKADGLHLYVAAEGFVPAGIALDEAQHPLVVSLVRAGEDGEITLEGLVLDERGTAVAGALVKLAESSTKSDRTGHFRLPIGHVAATTPLCAVKRGRLPALIPSFGEVIERQGGAPEPVELVLGAEPLRIRGRVVDDSGAACAGWSVSIADETAVSQYRIPLETAEGLARGRAEVVRTDGDGRFELTGLYPRDYRVQAFHRDTLLRTEATVAGGDDNALLRVTRALRANVHGTVVSGRGEPLADVRVALALDTVKTSFGSSSIEGAAVVTDETGTFVFDDVPAEHVYLRTFGEDVLPGAHELPAADGGRFELVVMQRCHFRIELAGTAADSANAADTAEFLDVEGTRLQVNRFEANGMSAFMSAKLADGASEVLSVSEAATTLVLKRGDVELARHALTLTPGDVNVLRF